VDVVVEVGGWEHECCGPAIERDQVVDFECIIFAEPDAQPRLVETHHDLDIVQPTVRIQGRVVDLDVVHDDGSTRSILGVPSGGALRGFGEDDGHLEDPWTGEVVAAGQGNEFLVTVRVSGWRLLDSSSVCPDVSGLGGLVAAVADGEEHPVLAAALHAQRDGWTTVAYRVGNQLRR